MRFRILAATSSLALVLGALAASAQTGSSGGSSGSSGSSSSSGSTGSSSGGLSSGSTPGGVGTSSGGRSTFRPPSSNNTGAKSSSSQSGTGSTQTSPLGATGQSDSLGQPGRTTGQPTTGAGAGGSQQQTGQDSQNQPSTANQLPNQLREQPSRPQQANPQNPQFQSSGGAARGQGSVPGGALVALTEEERRKIREIILKQTAAQEAKVNFKLMVGAKVPENISLRPMPQEAVNLVPRYKDFSFTVANDRIVIVQQGTREIDTMIPI
jgi:hypothetical protein